MKKLGIFLLFNFFLFSSSEVVAQKYSNGIVDLSEIKIQCEDIANAVKLSWRRSSSEYQEARRLYEKTQNSIVVMIDAFDSKIRSGNRITKEDIGLYISKIKINSDALAKYYNENKLAAGQNSAFNFSAFLIMGDEIASKMLGVIDKYRNYVIEKRLEQMHAAFDKCKLRNWDDI